MTNEIQTLKAELTRLKSQFNERVDAVEQRLNILIAKEMAEQPADGHIVQPIQTKPAEPQETSLEHLTTQQSDISLSTENAEQWQIAEPTSSPKKDASPSFIALFFKALLSALFDWLSPLISVYHSYKERGMLGIFILTVVGIALTLAGFGYLMQLLIDQLGVGIKVLLMSLAAMSVMGLGVALKLKTRFSEFSTAIVTLGILLSYSTVYFSGSVYGLLPNIVMLLLYLLIALTCHGLALWLDTKIVAGLGVIGIATMPLLSNTLELAPFYYLLSLLFITASSLLLAYRHTGRWLAHLSLAFTLLALEWILAIENVDISAWMVNAFYLLFFSYVAVALFRRADSHKSQLIFLAALLGSTILLFFQAGDVLSSQMSACFTVNALLTVTTSYLFYQVRHPQSHFLILLSALWWVLAVVSAISDAYWGIAWAVEGLMLLFIGRQYLLPQVIHQGQVLLVIALLYSWSALLLYFPLPALKSLDGWLLSLVIITVIAAWQRMINTAEVFDKLTLSKIKPALQLLEVIWLTVLLLACAHLWLGVWTGAAFIVVQLIILFRARFCQQIAIEIFGASLILVPLYYVYSGAMAVGSLRFTLLPLFAQFALISAFMQLWLWSAFYRKYYPNSSVKNLAEAARLLFYLLLPVCWLGSVIRRFEQDTLVLLWLSPLIALGLSLLIKHRYLITETKIITSLASLAVIALIGFLSPLSSFIALSGFTAFYGFAYYQHKRLNMLSAELVDNTGEQSTPLFVLQNSLYQFICSCGLVTLGIALPIMVGELSNSVLITFVIAALYWLILLKLLPVSQHARRNEWLITSVNLLLVMSAWFLTQHDVRFAFLPWLFIAACLYQKPSTFDGRLLGKKLGLNSDLFLHSITAITYTVLCLAVTKYHFDLLIAPLLAVHGAIILFVKDRRLTTVKYSFGLMLLAIIKLAFLDAANALLWQKVILFMGIGGFILAASFWYQKLVNKTV